MAIRFAALAFLAACGTPADDSADLDGEPIELEWSKGQSWHLAASYRNSGIMTDESAIDLESGEGDTFGESWSEPVVWRLNQLTGSSPSQTSTPLMAPNWRWNMPFQMRAVM